MKKLLPLLLITSCGPYYVGAKQVDFAEEFMAARPEVVAQPDPDPELMPTGDAPIAAFAPETETPVLAGPQPMTPVTEASVSQAKVYGWDGREVVPDARPLHGLDVEVDTHSNLLSMYMDAKESVDHLKLEVASLGDLLAHQDGMLLESKNVVGSKDEMIAALQLQIASDQTDREDLEARLVTAQIRRLEAERQLLLNILGGEPEQAEQAEEEPEAIVQAAP